MSHSQAMQQETLVLGPPKLARSRSHIVYFLFGTCHLVKLASTSCGRFSINCYSFCKKKKKTSYGYGASELGLVKALCTGDSEVHFIHMS